MVEGIIKIFTHVWCQFFKQHFLAQVTQYNMARRCKCAGDFKHTLAVKDTVQLVNTFRGIALHYR